MNIVNEISKFSKKIGVFFSKYKFDFIFIIGDRYEAHLLASISNIYNLPVIHVHGGEITEDLMTINFGILLLNYPQFISLPIKFIKKESYKWESQKKMFFVQVRQQLIF